MAATPAGAQRPALERRAVGLPTTISTVFGLIVASTVLLSVGQGFAASWIFLIALGIGLLAMFMQAISFSELATMMPKAGSMNEYVRAGLGAFAGTLTVLMGYIAIMVFPTAAESFIPAAILTNYLGSGIDVELWVVIIVGGVALLNLFGVRPFSFVEIVLTGVVALSVLAFGVLGLFGWGTGDPVSSALPSVDWDWSLLTALLGLAVFAFVGLEYACPLAEEVRKPSRDLPLGMFLGLALIAIPLALYGIGATRYVPPERLGDPEQLTHMEIAIAILGDGGKWWMGIVSIAATVATINALLAGIPRLLYGMSATRQVPPFFGYLLPATRAPVVGIVIMALIPILMNVFDATEGNNFISLILAGVLGWATAYILIHISLAVLRMREPDAPRPYRAPLFPVPQIIGTGILIWAAINIFPDPEIEGDIWLYYGVFLAISVAWSFIYNAVAMRSVTAQFRPVPLAEIREETEIMAEAEERAAGPDDESATLAKP